MNEAKTVGINVNDAEMTFETGRVALLASGSVLAQWGETVVLVTVVSSSPREGIDFFPLTVEYIEKAYAGGKIPYNKMRKREGFPGTDEILTARLIDRSIRPLFPKGFVNEVQVLVQVMSYDQVHNPDILSINAVSLALSISDIPFEGPISGAKIAKIGEELIVNPTRTQIEESDLDLVISGSKDSIVMIEAGANQVDESTMIDAMELAHGSTKEMLELQEKFIAENAKDKFDYEPKGVDEEVMTAVRDKFHDQVKEAVYIKEKQARSEKMDEAEDAAVEAFDEVHDSNEVKAAVDTLVEEIVVSGAVNEGIRPDGRGMDEIRPLSAMVGVLPRLHGTGLFQRGITQALTVVTLGSTADAMLVEGIYGEKDVHYFHHYNFKGFSVGEAGRFGYMPGRREVGHGALGERALIPVIPSKEDFPYTIRVVSEITSANGSTSMAATCGSTLALMDAGVPISAPVAGIAMGLIKAHDSEKMVILTDIQGFEDHFGDMDFKVTGTKDGITALQMDNKLKGIPREVLAEALEKAKVARLKILDVMLEAIDAPRKELSKFAPAIETIQIDKERIGELIGPGGKNIKKITEETGVEIDIEDDGTVHIASADGEAMAKAKKIIEGMFYRPEVGEVVEGVVDSIVAFGAFIKITPSVSGLVHVSEMSDEFVKDPSTIVKEGQKVTAKVKGIDRQGKIALTMKNLSGEKKAEKEDKKEDKKEETKE